MTYKIKVTEVDKNELWYKLTSSSTSKDDLTKDMGIDDRKLRAIASAINVNTDKHIDHIVLSDTDGGGYWKDAIGTNPTNVAALYNSEHNRGTSILTKATSIKLKGQAKYGKARFAQALEQIKRKADEDLQVSLFGGM